MMKNIIVIGVLILGLAACKSTSTTTSTTTSSNNQESSTKTVVKESDKTYGNKTQSLKSVEMSPAAKQQLSTMPAKNIKLKTITEKKVDLNSVK